MLGQSTAAAGREFHNLAELTKKKKNYAVLALAKGGVSCLQGHTHKLGFTHRLKKKQGGQYR